MKKAIILIVLILMSGVKLSLCQVEDNELIIKNESVTDTLLVSVRSIGFIFAGDKSYRPNSQWEENTQVILFGGNKKIFNDVVNPHNERFSLNHDCNSLPGTGNGSIGYGKYKVIISVSIPDTNGIHYFFPIDSVTIDYTDSDYPYGPSTQWPRFSNDFLLYYYHQDSILAEFKCGNCQKFNLDTTDREFEIWKQYMNVDSAYSKIRNKRYFISNEDFTEIPLISDRYVDFQHEQYENLFVDFTIDDSCNTVDTLLRFPTEICVKSGAALTISSGMVFTIRSPSNVAYNAFANLKIDSAAYLFLRPGSKIIVESPNLLTLENMSNLIMNQNSEIHFKQGSLFCNKGGKIFINGKIFFEKGMHQIPCDVESPVSIGDSAHIVLDSATLSLPDDYTLHLKGNETALILNPGSRILFGENSGIVCDSGARIIANDATFASADSTKKWSGISLNDLASDTIKNCTIKNAMYGIMISDRYDPEESPEPYSAEISDCSFVNQTSYVLNNAVYLQNSAHVLLKDNTITSNNLSVGFTHGIYAEYCPGEMLNIINNNISNCNNGMTIIQSSPYIAFNTLNGNSYGESGMFLDNSNGTIKYNFISDFYNSYYSFYSSPDLLKNTFDNSCDDNIYLSSSSVPVMHPLQSGGSVYWYAGDNLITGSPSEAGILFDSDAKPDLSYGYNRFVLQGSSYYINGANPTGGTRDFYAVKNFWYDNPPDSSKFNVENAESVIFSPYDNNSTSARATNNHQLDSIGFGMYDTLHFYESDNPNSAQELFLLAYQSEFNSEYDEAIGYYKEIVSDYKDSSNASSCLARIFNCYEKKQATVTEYSLLETYYSVLAADTAHSVIMRNISEDLAIQSNIKQGNIEEAISDYEEIYASNTNTQKGFHALINKEILAAGSGDNLSSGSTFEEIEFKQIKINSLLKGLNTKDANANFSTNSTPLSYSLSQNYPNPFNPSTRISYKLQVTGYIVLKVFDALGKEVVTLVNEMKNAGRHEVEFKASNLPSGVYFYSLSVDGKQTGVKLMALVK